MAGSLTDLFTAVQNGVVAINNLKTQFAKGNSPWTPYTPAIGAAIGTIVATSTGRYQQVGKTVSFQMSIIFSSAALGSGYIFASVPIPINLVLPTNGAYTMAGREDFGTGKMLQAITQQFAANRIAILNYDGSYPAVNVSVLNVTGIYEAA